MNILIWRYAKNEHWRMLYVAKALQLKKKFVSWFSTRLVVMENERKIQILKQGLYKMWLYFSCLDILKYRLNNRMQTVRLHAEIENYEHWIKPGQIFFFFF